ncbi:MAG: hypothetical protein PHP00_13660 [Thiotrichaceae bacterium]|nr:hypothetical protein [Thiotrichaceae bacterium]
MKLPRYLSSGILWCCLGLTAGCANFAEEESPPVEKPTPPTINLLKAVNADPSKSLLASTLSAGKQYVIPDEVAKRKASTENQEELVETESKRVFQLIREVKAINYQIKLDLSGARKKINKVKRLARKNKNKNTLLAQGKVEVINKYNETYQLMTAVDKELKTSEALLEELRPEITAANKGKFKGWELRIDALRKGRMQLEQYAAQLYALQAK